MSQATGLDHVGIVGHDLGTMAAAFEAAGFHLTPLARHAGGRTGNRCAMFRDGGYLELMATVDGGTSATLARFLSRHAGAHLLAFGVDDLSAACARLERAWGKAPAVSVSERAVDDADPAVPRARFGLIGPFDRPEGRVHLVHHETPDVLWQDRFVGHPNGAVALEEVVLTVPEPAVTAAWYSQLVGRPVVPDRSGGFALPLARGRVRILGGNGPTSARIAEISVRTSVGVNAQVEIGGTAIRFV
jgi:hypothetical protein